MFSSGASCLYVCIGHFRNRQPGVLLLPPGTVLSAATVLTCYSAQNLTWNSLPGQMSHATSCGRPYKALRAAPASSDNHMRPHALTPYLCLHHDILQVTAPQALRDGQVGSLPAGEGQPAYPTCHMWQPAVQKWFDSCAYNGCGLQLCKVH